MRLRWAATIALSVMVAGTASPAAADPPEPGPIATFHYTGAPQQFTVPADVTYLTFTVIGGRGGYPEEGADPGPGGAAIAGLDVTPGQKLTIWVGENAGRGGGWGYTCGGEGGEGGGIGVPGPGELAFNGGGGGGSSAVTAGAWSEGTGTCAASTRPSEPPLIVGGGGGGGGGRERVPFTDYQGGAGGAGGNPAQAGFKGGGSGPSPGGCAGCGDGNEGGHGGTESESDTDTMGGGGGGGGGYTSDGRGGGGGGRLPDGNGVQFGGAGGAGGTSFAAESTGQPIFVAGPLEGSGVVTVSAMREEGFHCAGQAVQHPSFPPGVEYARVTAEGGGGGNRTGSSQAPPGKGGYAGIASADLEGFAWDKISVIVGCRGTDGSDGGAGAGYGRGGPKGIANSYLGDDGSGGGGGSGVEIGEFPLVVAGGGGGGGGGAENVGTAISGGNGGNGGPSDGYGTWGHDGETEEGGDGGCGGNSWGRQSIVGGDGEGSSTGSGGGGGGGGGGGWGGGCGGEGGNFPSGGGGGGGGGGSYALEHSAAVTNPHFSTSEKVGNDGSVIFSYVVSTPSHISVRGGSGQQAPIAATFPKPLEAQVLDQLGRPLMGIPVTFTVPAPAPNAPSGQFAGGALTATADSDVDGIATSPAVVANGEVGSWQIEAEAGGAVPATFSLTNTTRPTATRLSASANPALAGAGVTFTATVEGTSDGPTPAGAIQFKSDGTDLGAPVALSAASAQKAADLAVGTHTIEAVFEPSSGFGTSSAKMKETVELARSATTVTSPSNPSEFEEPVVFTAHITNQGSETATGTVQFAVDGVDLGSPAAVSGGTAVSQALSTLGVGSHEVTASYSGNAFIASSEGELMQSVGPDATATELTTSVNPSVYGQALTYAAAVNDRGSATPTGDIAFLVDSDTVCDKTLSAGSATCSPPDPLSPGQHVVRADYAGNVDFSPSQGRLIQTVAKAPTQISLSADVAQPRVGEPVVFTAAVTVPPPGGGTPTGEVQFTLNGEPLGPPQTTSGGAVATPPISDLPVGMNVVGVEYEGDGHHVGSSEAIFLEVAPGETTATLTSSSNPEYFGVPIVFDVQLAAVAPAEGVPGGTVRFAIDDKTICDVPLSSAEASCQAPTLYAGEHRVTATYSGEPDFEASADSLTERIVRAPSRTIASTSASPAVAGEPVTLSANVTGGLPGERPTGTVSFHSGSRQLGSAPVYPTGSEHGRASIQTSSLPAGSHEIVATYSGDDAIEPSSAPPFEQAIDERAPPPRTCVAPNVRTRVLVFRGRNEVRLVARNRGAAQVQVSLRFSDRRGKRSKALGRLNRKVGVDGMVRVVKRLGSRGMAQLRRARGGFRVHVAIGASQGTCASESSRALSVRRVVSGQHVWFQRDSLASALPPNTR